MVRFTIRQPAPDGHRYAPGCFDGSVGKSLPLNLNGATIAAVTCTLVSVEIADDGSAALLTLDAPDTVRSEIQLRPAGLSFGA